jgi:hypothetical protein
VGLEGGVLPSENDCRFLCGIEGVPQTVPLALGGESIPERKDSKAGRRNLDEKKGMNLFAVHPLFLSFRQKAIFSSEFLSGPRQERL